MSGRPVRRRRFSRFGGAHLAGWLFADLMLVLFLVAMAVQPREQLANGTPDQHTKPPTGPRVLSQHFCEFMIPAQAEGLIGGSASARTDLLAKLNEALRGKHPSWLYGPEMKKATGRARCDAQMKKNSQVGMFLTYGARSDTGSGVILGRNAAKAIKDGNPRFREAIYRAAWTGGEDAVQIVIFFYDN